MTAKIEATEEYYSIPVHEGPCIVCSNVCDTNLIMGYPRKDSIWSLNTVLHAPKAALKAMDDAVDWETHFLVNVCADCGAKARTPREPIPSGAMLRADWYPNLGTYTAVAR